MKIKGSIRCRKLFAGLLAALFVLIAACTYGDTARYTEHAGKVRVELDWGKAPRPEAVLFYFYPDGKDTPLLRTGTADGFVGTLPDGSYRMVAVNADYRNLAIRTDRGYDGVYAHLVDETKQPTKADPNLLFPDNLYSAGHEGIVVDSRREATYLATTQNLVQTLLLDIVFKGVEQVASVAASISGMSASVHLPTGQPHRTQTALLSVPIEKQVDGSYRSSFNTFGVNPTLPHHPVPVVPNRLILDVTLANVTSFTSEVDLTRAIDEAIANGGQNGHVETIIEVEIEVDPTNPGGFRLQLVGWQSGTGSAGNDKNENK